MNKVMRNNRNIITFMFLMISLLTSAELLGQAPYINNLDKTSATVGETVTVTGSNFSNNIADLYVKFGSVKATITSASLNLLEVIVPAGATLDK